MGLGETRDEVLQVMDDLLAANVDFLTIGQYLQPSVRHYPLDRYVHPDEFAELKSIALSKGFLIVASSPLTRSSYHADEDFSKMKKLREKQVAMPSASIKKKFLVLKKILLKWFSILKNILNLFLGVLIVKFMTKPIREIQLKLKLILTIGKSFFKDTYKSFVIYNKSEDSIHVTNMDGPLKHLENEWFFRQEGDSSEVEFSC